MHYVEVYNNIDKAITDLTSLNSGVTAHSSVEEITVLDTVATYIRSDLVGVEVQLCTTPSNYFYYRIVHFNCYNENNQLITDPQFLDRAQFVWWRADNYTFNHKCEYMTLEAVIDGLTKHLGN